MNQNLAVIIAAALISSAIGALAAFGVISYQKLSEQDLIKEFYDVENAVYVSPHGLRQKMSKGEINDYILVDLRSAQEYEKEHIVTAVNIPAYKDANTSAYDEQERILNEFRALTAKNKEIIVYCYSMPCMTGRKIGKMLAENGIYTKHLGIGWNEWRYFWNLWNHDGETPSKMEDYIAKGKEPGMPKISELPSPCEKGEFGC